MRPPQEIHTNQDTSKLKLYGGIALAGIATGAAIAVRNDPMYDYRKRVYGGKTANAPYRNEYMSFILEPTDIDMYDLAKKNRDYAAILKYETQARNAFQQLPYEEQLHLGRGFEKALAGEMDSGTMRARLLKAMRKVTKL